MALSAEEIIQVMRTAKELGLTSFKSADIEFTSQAASAPIVEAPKVSKDVPELKPEDIVNPMSVLDDLDEDEIKYWATPYYDEIQAKKEMQRQQIKDSEVK